MKPFLCLATHVLVVAVGLVVLHRMAPTRPRPLTVGVAIAASLLLAPLVFVLSEPRLEPLSDFYKAYYPAGRAVLQGSELRPLLESRDYVNLPIVAVTFVPFGLLERPLVGYVFTVFGIVLAVVAWRLVAKAARLRGPDSFILLFLFSLNGPLHYSLKEGNTTHVVLALIAFAFLLLRDGRRVAAGVVLGTASIVKLPLLVFVAYFVVRRRTSEALGMVAAAGAIALASVVVFGWDLNALWYECCVAPFSTAPMSAFNVQSIHGALARLDRGPDALLDWDPKPLTLARRTLATLLVSGLYGSAIAAALKSRRAAKLVGAETVRELEFLMVLMLALISGPMAWSHYYLWLLFPAAFLLGDSEHLTRDAKTRMIGWVAVLVAGTPVTLIFASNELVSNLYVRFLVSNFLLGGLAMFFVLVRSLATARGVDGRAS